MKLVKNINHEDLSKPEFVDMFLFLAIFLKVAIGENQDCSYKFEPKTLFEHLFGIKLTIPIFLKTFKSKFPSIDNFFTDHIYRSLEDLD